MTKFCKDCKHYQLRYGERSSLDKCQREVGPVPAPLDEYCTSQRGRSFFEWLFREQKCGPTGKFWEAKE